MASTLKINTLTGVTTAGSIAVTGEGNSTTTNLQQGLLKQWCRIVQTGTQSIGDSFNTSGITDDGTGKTTFAFTNAMNSATDYAVFSTSNQEGATSEHSEILAANYEVRSIGHDGSLADGSQISAGVAGDLA
tara:strand:+ start:127 stop:522 length:396 start_codon:yes stop_codon:yes gene_type:complete